ncbi:MAG: helix-turn-helix domain-containing protein [Acidobacteriota bacterium]
MPVSSPNPEAGRRLRAIRERLGLSTREVERLSRALADSKQNQEYYLSHAWLSQIERGELTPGIYKIYTLSTIYQQRLDQVLGFFGIRISDIGREQVRQPLPNTDLVGAPAAPGDAVSASQESIQTERTDLVSRMFSSPARHESRLFPQNSAGTPVYGYIGTKDYTLYPMIRPGTFVEIDPMQRRIESGAWASVFERPIYFVELRDEYVCSWCEEREGSLVLIPYPQSGCRVREVRHPSQGEVIGRVTAINMRIAESRERRVALPARA